MKAIVFAAGIGSRLKPFTDHSPKALAPVAGVPALQRVMEKLISAGADGIIVNVHHFPDQIRDFIGSRHWDADIEFSDESGLLLDTAGALAKIARESRIFTTVAPDEPIVVHNADIITDFDLTEMTDCHIGKAASATILVDPQRQSTRRFLFDAEGHLKGWKNLTTGEIRPASLDDNSLIPAAFGGVHVLSRGFIERLSNAAPTPLAPFSITPYYIDHAASEHIVGFTPKKSFRWFDIGTTEKLAEASAAMA